MPTFTANGVTINYSVSGRGQPLVFLHGLGANLRCWRYQEHFFSSRYTVVLMDLRGFGRSEKPTDPAAYRVELFAQDLHLLIQHLGLPAIHLVGTSMGGYVAQQFSLSYPDEIKSLTLCNTACRRRVPGEVLRSRLEALQHLDMRSYARLVASQALAPGTSPEIVEEIVQMISRNEKMAYETVIRWLRFDVCERLQSLRLPVLLIGCGKDIVVPLDRVKEIHKFIPHAQLRIIEDSGHLPYLEKPNVFNHILSSFIETVQNEPLSERR